MAIFFSNGNQLYPPCVSDQGILRSFKKSDIMKCIKPFIIQGEEIVFNFK